MPFGISSAPKVWQRQMHEFAQDLNGFDIIADDLLNAGFEETGEEVDRSLETNEPVFFKKCREWNLKLNKGKLKRSQTEVRFVAHLITADGLKADTYDTVKTQEVSSQSADPEILRCQQESYH
ncbi:Hypothetical predicted protein [Paramuricea clavata]|uniref:Uncharacterized protein n=1 Tax=Paramuricea clavata TaxID=317549 RepID=A0A6S7K0B0_PARCT|nr:Hypothetical predicted protein [Paramuricea clavata]